MKKSDIFLILGLVVVLVLGFFVMKGDVYKPGYELPLTLKGEAGLKQLTYKEYQEKIDNDEHFVVILERTSCSYCQEFMPVAEKLAKDKKVPLYYVDTDTFSDYTTKSCEGATTNTRVYLNVSTEMDVTTGINPIWHFPEINFSSGSKIINSNSTAEYKVKSASWSYQIEVDCDYLTGYKEIHSGTYIVKNSKGNSLDAITVSGTVKYVW